MGNFSYVFTGNNANDGTGTPLRTAFQIIDQNFANIAAGNATIPNNAPVQSVAGRTGNVILDRKSTRLNSSHTDISRMPSSA